MQAPACNVGNFVLPAAPASATEDSEKKLEAIKDILRKGLFLEDKVPVEDLRSPTWLDTIIAQARQEDLKQLAASNGLPKSGSKAELAKRIFEAME